ncbi:uncharacterized protein K02A2.6-like [Macrosteles quadrilineatus]|uniref:uncharacterized protein K02A2.6-like n=1 Tax=Macrosteles quadrilineatus TaxID=74068 RepID=UPI0023E23D1D|nr:uncharacterized protein K02A2.6-like [Macrosteles quadrilineatus]
MATSILKNGKRAINYQLNPEATGENSEERSGCTWERIEEGRSNNSNSSKITGPVLPCKHFQFQLHQATVSTDDGQSKVLPLVVVKNKDPNQPILMGRNWLQEIKLDWSRINGGESSSLLAIGKTVPIHNTIKDLRAKYNDVFDGKFGEIKDVEVNLVLKENARPVFCKPHNVPFALRPAVEAELKKLEDNGIIKPVTQSEWATPLVVVRKVNDIVVSADASHYGLGAVLALVLPNGSERPVAFASRTLGKSEIKYAQVEKEALALIFAVRKFHNFLYGRKFTLVTDHRALTFLLGPTKAIPTLAAARIQRWALILATYQYDLLYKKGADHGNADALSRLPCKGEEEEEIEGEINFFAHSQKFPISYKEIGVSTKYDPILSKVLDLTRNGWPAYTNDIQLRPYSDKALQLSVEKDCLLWGSRVIIPRVHQEEVLQLLQTEHPGESRMKAISRSFVWWPKLDVEIEEFVKKCSICQKTRKSMPVVPLQPWSWPNRNWQRLHLDFAAYEGKDFLILVDSRSKWPEIFHMKSTTSAKVIEKLRTCFAAYGLPNTVVTDGGTQFTSQEFNDFLKFNGIRHLVSPPYHPASNGLAERMVQTTKDVFLKQLLEDSKTTLNRTLQHRLDRFLFAYRNTPHSTTGMTPAEMFLKTTPRTPLSLLKPHLSDDMKRKQEETKTRADTRRGKQRSFNKGDMVLVRTVRQEKINWQSGVIFKVVSPVTYLVNVEGKTRFIHADHLKLNPSHEDEEEQTLPRPDENTRTEEIAAPAIEYSPRQTPTKSPSKSRTRPSLPQNQDSQESPGIIKSPERVNLKSPDSCIRRSKRTIKPPDKLNL